MFAADAALELALDIYLARPELLIQAHRDGPFAGETALHIVAINRREEALCSMIHVAHENLNPEELSLIFLTQATGEEMLSTLPLPHTLTLALNTSFPSLSHPRSPHFLSLTLSPSLSTVLVALYTLIAADLATLTIASRLLTVACASLVCSSPLH